MKASTQIYIDLVEHLAEVLHAAQLSTVEIRLGERRIRVARELLAAAPVPGVDETRYHTRPLTVHALPAVAVSTKVIKSQTVGIAYLSAEHDAEPFVIVGEEVGIGDTLLIIAMLKVKVPISAIERGVISAIFVNDGQPIEYDQPLMAITVQT